MQGHGDPNKYNLPPPSPALSASAIKKDAQLNGAAVGEEEKENWQKYGWEPRFGDGRTEEDKEAEESSTLIDHQTYLEGVLDEKFYGGQSFSSLGVSNLSLTQTRLVSQHCCDHLCLLVLMARSITWWWPWMADHHYGYLQHILPNIHQTSPAKCAR